jgi:hypothetical protein
MGVLVSDSPWEGMPLSDVEKCAIEMNKKFEYSKVILDRLVATSEDFDKIRNGATLSYT